MFYNLVFLYPLDDPLKENLPPFSLSNASSTQRSKHTGVPTFLLIHLSSLSYFVYLICVIMFLFQLIGSSTTQQQPITYNRTPLGDVTNRELLLN